MASLKVVKFQKVFHFGSNIQIKVPKMARRVVEFSSSGYKLERFLNKNQHTQRKLLNFEFWINDELSKIGRLFSNKKIQKMILSKKCSYLYSSMKKKLRKI